MPSFSYMALDPGGGRKTGVSEAADMHELARSLRSMGLFILEIREVSARRRPPAGAAADGERPGFSLARHVPVTSRDKAQFFRQMSLMLRSGLPLLEVLEFLEAHSPKIGLSRAAGRIARRIGGGSSFSSALAAEGRLFPQLAIKMAAAGEASGELGAVLNRVADQIERKAELTSSLMTSLAYPALVVAIATAVVAFLVTRVIPKFAHMLAGRNIAMPSSTQLLVNVTEFLNRYGPGIIAGVSAAALILAALRLSRKGRWLVDRTLLSLPVVGRVLTLAFVAHFGATMAILLRSGVSVLDGLKLLRESVSNGAFAECIRRAESALVEGRPLSKGLSTGIIPPLLPELAAVGEATGTLDGVMDEMGRFFEKRLQLEIRWLATIFEPAMILFVGGIVGFVYIAFFQVLYQMAAR
ncbi:MAG: type II secretion system F family protein [Planctomycetota bacterium]|nr:type II secretion system F family protein [Planctomycetota bacterium]